MLVALSAVLIGVCALGVSLYETSLMRNEQRAAVLPLLELSRSYSINRSDGKAEQRLYLQAENVGIGPARIEDFVVEVDGKAYPTWGAAMQALTGADRYFDYGHSTINQRTLPPDRNVRMYHLAETDFADEIIEQFERLNYRACYCSVFGECWATSYKEFGTTRPVERCTPGPDSFQE